MSYRMSTCRGFRALSAALPLLVLAADAAFAASIVSSNPPSGSIDARYPHSRLNQSIKFGWDEVELTFDQNVSGLTPSDFALTTTGGTAPTISSVQCVGSTATLQLSGPIPAGEWTNIEHTASGTEICLGFLPGDVAGNGNVGWYDYQALSDNVWGALDPPLGLWQCDINRDGVCLGSDILPLLNLFGGREAFDPWEDEYLPAAPCADGPSDCAPAVPVIASGAGCRYLELAIQAGSEPFMISVKCPDGATRWVDTPGAYDRALLVSSASDAAFLTPAEWPASVYVTSDWIRPDTEYLVQADYRYCITPAPVTGTTWLWGDVDHNGTVNSTDYYLILQWYNGNHLVTRYAADLESCVPNGIPNIADVQWGIKAWQGYPFTTWCSGECN